MTESHRRFVEDFANPHAWLLVADDLYEQAVALYNQRDSAGMMVKTHHTRNTVQQTMVADKPAFLLGGFAIENTIKAFLVFENPSWIADGHLSKKLQSHRLTTLQERSTEIPRPAGYHRVLAEFESGLDSWFRYPCGLTIQTSMEERGLHKDLWEAYLGLMRAYAKKLGEMFDRGWQGPHDVYGRWKLHGTFLGHRWPLEQVPPLSKTATRTRKIKGKTSKIKL